MAISRKECNLGTHLSKKRLAFIKPLMGKKVRLVRDVVAVADIPKRYIGRTGVISGVLSETYDEYSVTRQRVVALLVVTMKDRKKPLHLYEDEIEII